MQFDRQERKEELAESQNQKLLSEFKSADVWYQHSATHLYELGCHVDRFLITKVGVFELLGHWKEYMDNNHTNTRPRG